MRPRFLGIAQWLDGIVSGARANFRSSSVKAPGLIESCSNYQ